WSDISRTFQDATSFICRLSMWYIWIDSLCIIQNDLADWRKEAAKMADIYTSPYFTVAAVSAAHAGAGLYQEIPLEMRACPTTDLGMACQERFLSKRVLFFLRGELVWICQSCIDNESKSESLGCHPNYRTTMNDWIYDTSIQFHWQEIVTEYTQPSLSFGKDKLPAIRGIAARIYGYRERPYLAGFWKDSLLSDLSWYVENDGFRPFSNRAPT
ncbi:hypothetical protein K469DRAFT_566363, partial [Zopfia rhizophila CBS 207.26]